MPATTGSGVGRRIATARRIAHMTQQDLADAAHVSYATVRAIERGAREPSDRVLDALADALNVDPSRLLTDLRRTTGRVHDAMPALSAAIATYDLPEDGPTRPLPQLQAAVEQAVTWRLAAQYVRLADTTPGLLEELARALHSTTGRDRVTVARLLVAAYRAADAVAYKFGHRDLSARLVELMRWATEQADSPVLSASTAYVRAETYFAARSHAAGLRVLEAAIDAGPAPTDAEATAARGALHMRAAVIAARAGNPAAADTHLQEARVLGDRVGEGVYQGTAFGPSSVRIHEVSTAVSLGTSHVQRALDVAHEWKPGPEIPPERRSGFYIELARAQVWTGRHDDALESLKVARRIAPQHAREHPWVLEDATRLLRHKRRDRESLDAFIKWVGVG